MYIYTCICIYAHAMSLVDRVPNGLCQDLLVHSISMHVRIYTCMYVCMYVCAQFIPSHGQVAFSFYSDLSRWIHACMHVCTQQNICMYICACICICIYTDVVPTHEGSWSPTLTSKATNQKQKLTHTHTHTISTGPTQHTRALGDLADRRTTMRSIPRQKRGRRCGREKRGRR